MKTKKQIKQREMVKEAVKEILIENNEFFVKFIKEIVLKTPCETEKKHPIGFIIN